MSVFDLKPSRYPGESPSYLLANLPDVCRRHSCLLEVWPDSPWGRIYRHYCWQQVDKLLAQAHDYDEDGPHGMLLAWVTVLHKRDRRYYGDWSAGASG